MTELCDLTATVLLKRLAGGATSATAVMEACLARIEAREGVVRALTHLAPQAAPDGPLGGLPLGVKDILDVAGMPTGHGSPIWAGWMPRAEAACVALARRAGAAIIGKTVTTEFATRRPGPTTNPHDPRCTPGGSSSGSAAGVAAGFFPFAFGTQTAGSIIRPAAYCGAVGYKPSYGLIHRAGMKVMSEELDTIGAMARSVADCALLIAAITGLDLGDPERVLERAPRLLLCLGPGAAAAAPETVALIERAADAVARRGATVVRQELPAAVEAAHGAHPLVMNGESAQALAWELSEYADDVSPELRERLLGARGQGAAALAAARGVLLTARTAFPSALDGFDAIVTPAAPGEAPEGLGWTGDPAFNAIWTSLHVPCVTVPAGTGPRGLPLGIQVVGRYGEDRALLAVADWVRAALG